MTAERTDYCGTLGIADVGRTVTVCGWVHRRRDHGGLIFLDLRDRSGILQVVVEPASGEAFAAAERARAEWVLAVTGTVRARPEGMVNPELATGAIELAPERIEILSQAKTPPFLPAEADDVDELVRLKYRYLDLRRPSLLAHFVLRDRVVFAARQYLHAHGFLDVETPALAKSTPEGARDFLVPSRTQRGRFYALPQSPQLFKQLLMVAGFDRYYQIVKVFRDEDLRADRQPEFTQIDVETSFLSQDRILELMEGLVHHIFRETLGITLEPFVRLTYAEAMRRYGSDKPDLRAGPALVDLTAARAGLGFAVLAEAPAVVGVPLAGVQPSRRQLDAWVDAARQLGAGGLVWIIKSGDGVRSNAQRALGEAGAEQLLRAAGLGPGDGLLVVAGPEREAQSWAGALRLRVAEDLGRMEDGFRFLWVTDFPLFEWSEEEKRLVSAHHPFTRPHPEDEGWLDRDPARVRALAYDVVLNGVELASGSLRIYEPELQAKVFRILGLKPEEIEAKFGFLLNAFQYGAPPHGGIAFGLDRLVMIMAGAKSIRDVIAFPKTARGTDPLLDSPSPVEPAQLEELGIRIIPPR